VGWQLQYCRHHDREPDVRGTPVKGRKSNKLPKAKKAVTFAGKETPAEELAEAREMPPVSGFKARMRLDRPGRKLGGRVGADRAPLSSAAKSC
jgi:hypothetical protein